MNTYETKIIQPRLHGVVPRERLFRLLDEKSEYPVTWVSSPAGSGKTTLVASYVQSRNIPVIWYRVDETDGDVAGFFYNMGKAAKKLKRGRAQPLPLFTPEYRLGITAFTRHYFESLFQKMRPPAIIIFDNYQDAPDNAEFHEVLRNGLKVVPEGIRILLVSRKEHPASFVSLKAESMLSSIGWEEIRFSLDEVREIMLQRKKETAPEALVRRIHEETQGWAAAVILMLDASGKQTLTPKSIGHSSIFSYLTVEVFHRLDERIKDFLLLTALLPSISPEIASRLTGVHESEAILDHLSNNHYFTDRYGDTYHYHPLFREFLLDAAKKRYGFEELITFTIRAGQLLAQSGRTEEAVRLLLDTGAFSEALPLILAHAQTLLTQGRDATLEEWATKLPEEMRENTPWLLYWLGMGQLLTNPADARRRLEKAFRLFEAKGDKTGCLLSAASMMNSIVLGWDDYHPLDTWIEWIDQNVDPHTPLPDHAMEAQITSAMVLGLTWRMFWHPNMLSWIERVLAASRQVEELSVRLTAKSHVMEYLGFMGHWAEMRLVAEECRQIAFSPDASPLVHLSYMVRVIETHDWINGSWKDTYNRLQKAWHLAETVGAYFHLGNICLHGVWIAFEIGNLQLAQDFLGKMEQSAFSERLVGRAFYRNINALFYLQKGDDVSAHYNSEDAVKASVEAGAPILEAWSRVGLAYSLRKQGKNGAAMNELKQAEETVKPVGTTHTLYLVRLTQASLLLDEGDRKAGDEALREAFRIGRERGYGMTLFLYWQPDEMARLCAEALSAGIEVAYARELIRNLHLLPKTVLEYLSNWPWPYRIHTLGRFEIQVNDKPLAFTGKVQKKPLALLKALIALGGKDVREDAIEDMLWPEAEGDMAHISLKTTVSRLRRLLGNEQVIEVKEGKISLNTRMVWLDTWALDSLAGRMSDLSGYNKKSTSLGEAEKVASLLIDFYRGEFLPGDDDDWIDTCRNRIRSKSLRVMEKLMRAFQNAGKSDRAAALIENALERGLSVKNTI